MSIRISHPTVSAQTAIPREPDATAADARDRARVRRASRIPYGFACSRRLDSLLLDRPVGRCLVDSDGGSGVSVGRLVLERFSKITDTAGLPGLPGFYNKTCPVVTLGGKYTFLASVLCKIRIPRSKYHVIGVVSTRGNSVKVTQFMRENRGPGNTEGGGAP